MRVSTLVLAFLLLVEGCIPVIRMRAEDVRSLPVCFQIVHQRATMPPGVYYCQNNEARVVRQEIVLTREEVSRGANGAVIIEK